MSELSMHQAIDRAFTAGRRDPEPGERIVYDDGFTRFFVKDPPELIDLIHRHKLRALASPNAWVAVLDDFATDQLASARKGKLTHACFDAAVAGDTAQLGALMFRALRTKLEEKAEDAARDDYEDQRELNGSKS